MNGGIVLSWPAVGAISGITTAVITLQTVFFRLFVKGAMADMTKELNGKYVGAKVCDKAHEEVDRRLSVLEEAK